jgi:hypothetical protein
MVAGDRVSPLMPTASPWAKSMEMISAWSGAASGAMVRC